jgi:hypothetical protein
MVAKGNIAKRGVNEASSSYNPTKKMKGEKEFTMLNIDGVAIKMQGAHFEGKVMNRYGSWNHGKSTYKCLWADVVGHEGF